VAARRFYRAVGVQTIETIIVIGLAVLAVLASGVVRP
jgi:hypothetical protein